MTSILHPFVIWTTQRTGSTVSSAILRRLSGQDIAQEPFNGAKHLAYHKDEKKLALHLQNLDGLCFKHCWNIHPEKFNRMILDQIIGEKYKFVTLNRRNVLKMWLSTQLARQTGVWGKGSESSDYFEKKLQPLDIDLLKHDVIKYTNELDKFRDLLAQDGCSIFEIAYEDLFEGDIKNRFNHWERLCGFLQIAAPSLNDATIVDLIMHRKQGTEELYARIPNLQEVQEVFPEYDLHVQASPVSPVRNPGVPPTKFLIVTGRYTGLDTILSLLNAHKAVRYWGEILRESMLRIKGEAISSDPVGYIKQCFETHGPMASVGCTILYHQLDKAYESKWHIAKLSEMRNFLQSDKEIRIVHLKRQNRLATVAVSRLDLEIRRLRRKGKAGEMDNIAFTLPPAKCEQMFNKIETQEKMYDALFHDHETMDIYFEDVMTDPAGKCDDLMAFLNLPPQVLQCDLLPPMPALFGMIKNYDRLHKYFKETEWEVFFKMRGATYKT